jgi:hypothetical protein
MIAAVYANFCGWRIANSRQVDLSQVGWVAQKRLWNTLADAVDLSQVGRVADVSHTVIKLTLIRLAGWSRRRPQRRRLR